MNYREKIRKAIECPQFGDATYGEWGALNLEKRRYIKRLLDELDSADNCLKRLYLENQKYKEVIGKAIEYIESKEYEYGDEGQDNYIYDIGFDEVNELLDILKGMK